MNTDIIEKEKRNDVLIYVREASPQAEVRTISHDARLTVTVRNRQRVQLMIYVYIYSHTPVRQQQQSGPTRFVRNLNS